MSAAKNNLDKRKYKYPTRPLYWSLNAKSAYTASSQEKSDDKTVIDKKV
jgi:hypothetical protein